jgi:hypothetical protein
MANTLRAANNDVLIHDDHANAQNCCTTAPIRVQLNLSIRYGMGRDYGSSTRHLRGYRRHSLKEEEVSEPCSVSSTTGRMARSG